VRIKLTSIMVDNQDKALKFYTEVFGFVKKHEIPVGEYRWLTVVSPEGRDDLELSLEPNANPAGKTFQEALFKQGIPATAFEADDLEAECRRLREKDVVFTQEPTRMGPVGSRGDRLARARPSRERGTGARPARRPGGAHVGARFPRVRTPGSARPPR